MGLKNGKSKWILLHIEVQSYFEKLFGRRMFIIFSWLFTKYDESSVALAIYICVLHNYLTVLKGFVSRCTKLDVRCTNRN
jgi:hypothetical protein